ncbi:MAG: hypothetical protein ACM3X4_01445 [Ignavibacteriales bacterium]
MVRVRKGDVVRVTTSLIGASVIRDLSIEEPPIEAVIDQVYREGVTQ